MFDSKVGYICWIPKKLYPATVACLSGRTLAAGATFLQVFRVVGTAALLGYGAAHV